MPFLDLTQVPGTSFRYADKGSGELLPGWKDHVATDKAPGGAVTHSTRTDPATGLKVTVHVRRFDDFPAADWVVEFENCGSADTPILADILAMDVLVPIPPQQRLRLHHANGSSCRMDDFLPLVSEMPPHCQKTLAPVGGRSSNGTLPFMNFQREGGGLVLAVGWSGQWSARFERGADSLRLCAGMERTHLRLHPGEKIRTPRILALTWEGDDPTVGNNLLRRLLIAHYLPRIDGRLVTPPAAQCLQAYFYLTGKACEQFEMTALPKTAAIGAEAYWIDACWYGRQGEWWQEVGSWVVNRDKFPNGLKPISDAAHEAGMKFVLWFEPERVRTDSLLHREHSEFLLAGGHDPSNLLFNLGSPEARRHITDLISRLITENGVDVYRQDFNFDPLPYWQAADAPDRIGMTEIRHVEGLYALWDELRRRHPGLWVDNCASGGRRIDLETISRSLPLWASDFPDVGGLTFGQGLHVGDQCIKAGLARWVPLFGGGVWNFTPYGTRGEVIGGFTFGFHIDRKDLPPDEGTSILGSNDVLAKGKTLLDDDFPLADARAAVDEWKSIRQFFLGDFHLLLPLTVGFHDWCAWQFHREDLAAGVAMFFRRHRSPFPTMEIELKCVDPAGQYDVSLSAGYREAPRRRMKGADLSRMSVTIPETPGSLLLRYTRAT
ncbi:MAG TPA: glycoside hydrolase family 36 protein [Phycisphaerae bacterium]|nr:glycoside hydrolase family 36 protein [Phycisphaerae bacterium]